MGEELNQKQKKIFTEFIKIFSDEKQLEILEEFIKSINDYRIQNAIEQIGEIDENKNRIEVIFKKIQEIEKDTQKSQEDIDEVYWNIFDIEKEDRNESSKLKKYRVWSRNRIKNSRR